MCSREKRGPPRPRQAAAGQAWVLAGPEQGRIGGPSPGMWHRCHCAQQSPYYLGWGWGRMKDHEDSTSLWPEAGKTPPPQRQAVLSVPRGRQAGVVPPCHPTANACSHVFNPPPFPGRARGKSRPKELNDLLLLKRDNDSTAKSGSSTASACPQDLMPCATWPLEKAQS